MTSQVIDRPALKGFSFAITDDLDAHRDRSDCLDIDALDSELIAAISRRRTYREMPESVATHPIPLRRTARHFEPLFEAVSDAAYIALRSILGSTIESAEQFLIRSPNGETNGYHRIATHPRPIEVDWQATLPKLEGVDTSDELATRKALRRQPGTVLALRDDHIESTELLQLSHLSSMYPLVTKYFIEAWSAAELDYKGMESVDGPYLLPVVTSRLDYRWVPASTG